MIELQQSSNDPSTATSSRSPSRGKLLREDTSAAYYTMICSGTYDEINEEMVLHKAKPELDAPVSIPSNIDVASGESHNEREGSSQPGTPRSRGTLPPLPEPSIARKPCSGPEEVDKKCLQSLDGAARSSIGQAKYLELFSSFEEPTPDASASEIMTATTDVNMTKQSQMDLTTKRRAAAVSRTEDGYLIPVNIGSNSTPSSNPDGNNEHSDVTANVHKYQGACPKIHVGLGKNKETCTKKGSADEMYLTTSKGQPERYKKEEASSEGMVYLTTTGEHLATFKSNDGLPGMKEHQKDEHMTGKADLCLLTAEHRLEETNQAEQHAEGVAETYLRRATTGTGSDAEGTLPVTTKYEQLYGYDSSAAYKQLATATAEDVDPETHDTD